MLVLPELLLEVRRGEGVHRVEVLLRLLLSVGLGERGALVRLLDRNARALGEITDRLGERVSLVLDEEVDGAAGLLAPEAVEVPALRVHVEARRLLLVERAEPDEGATAALEGRHRILNELQDVRLLADLRDGIGGNHGE